MIICGTNGWNLLDPVMSLMGNSTDMQLFIFEEDASVRITINETIEHLYAGCSKLLTISILERDCGLIIFIS